MPLEALKGGIDVFVNNMAAREKVMESFQKIQSKEGSHSPEVSTVLMLREPSSAHPEELREGSAISYK